MQRVMRIFATTAALGLLVALTASLALAHAHYKSSTPPTGATVTAAPDKVTVVFGEEPSATQSTLMVMDASGAQVDNGDGKVDQTDPDRSTMVATLKNGLPDGLYTVKYHTVTEDDSGILDGSFMFGVNAAVPAAQAQPQEKESGGDDDAGAAKQPAASGQATTAGGPSQLPNTGAADAPAPLPILLAGAMLLAGGLALRARRPASR